MCKVSSGQFSSLIKLSLSGYCYPSDPLISHFDKSRRYPDLEQVTPLLHPLCWPRQDTQEFLKSWLRDFFFLSKFPLFAPTILHKHPAFHTAQLTDQAQDYLGQGPLWPNSSPISRCHLAPNFSGTAPLVTTVPVGEHHLCAPPLHLYPPCDFKCPGLSWHRTGFPALGGEGTAKLQSLIRLSSKASVAAGPGLQQPWLP